MRIKTLNKLIAKAKTYLEISKKIKISKKLILVHTMGKVGSSSIYESLKIHHQNIPAIFHTHRLNKLGIKKAERFHKSFENKIPYNLFFSKILSNFIKKRPLYIITLVRNPIEREISNYFQIIQRSKNFKSKSKANYIQDIKKNIKKNIVNSDSHLNTWFDMEIWDLFGIDVYKTIFRHEKGFQIFEKNEIKLLLIRLENLNESWENICSEFFGEEIELIIKNESNKKNLSEEYNFVVENLKLDKELKKHFKSNKIIKHFYKDKKNEIINKWFTD